MKPREEIFERNHLLLSQVQSACRIDKGSQKLPCGLLCKISTRMTTKSYKQLIINRESYFREPREFHFLLAQDGCKLLSGDSMVEKVAENPVECLSGDSSISLGVK